MQDFLKEWGPAIITALVVLVLIGLVKVIAPMVTSMMKGTINNFSDTASLNNDAINDIIKDNSTP